MKKTILYIDYSIIKIIVQDSIQIVTYIVLMSVLAIFYFSYLKKLNAGFYTEKSIFFRMNLISSEAYISPLNV